MLRNKLIKEAGLAGCEIVLRDGCIDILGKIKVRIWPDGVVTRIDIPLNLAKKMTIKETYKALIGGKP